MAIKMKKFGGKAKKNIGGGGKSIKKSKLNMEKNESGENAFNNTLKQKKKHGKSSNALLASLDNHVEYSRTGKPKNDDSANRARANTLDALMPVSKYFGNAVFSSKSNSTSHPSSSLQLAQFKRRGHRVSTCCLSVDARTLFSCGKEGGVIAWDIATHTLQHYRPGGISDTQHAHKNKHANTQHPYHCCKVLAAAANPEFLATGDTSGLVFVWRLPHLEKHGVLTRHRSRITALAFRKHAEHSGELFSGSSDGRILVWNLNLMQVVEELIGHSAGITALHSLQLGHCLSCSCVGEAKIRLWKIETGNSFLYDVPEKPPQAEDSFECAVLLNENYFVGGFNTNKLYLWDAISKRKPIAALLNAHKFRRAPPSAECDALSPHSTPIWITALCALAKSDVIASGSSEGEVCVWKVSSKGFQLITSLVCCGVINALQMFWGGAAVGDARKPRIAVALSQEYRLGRWLPRFSKGKEAVQLFELTDFDAESCEYENEESCFEAHPSCAKSRENGAAEQEHENDRENETMDCV